MIMTNPQPYWQAPPPIPRPTPTAPPKSPGVAVILTLLVPGLGHLYSGNPIAAILWFITAVIVGTLTALLGLLIVYPIAMIHAHAVTTAYNRRHNAVL
jgi:TM2 domain-containing membrane protein YozV